MRNEFKTTLQVRRIDICDLMLACSLAGFRFTGAEKWNKLHDELKRQLDELDVQLDNLDN